MEVLYNFPNWRDLKEGEIRLDYNGIANRARPSIHGILTFRIDVLANNVGYGQGGRPRRPLDG